mmetsp:Transcript_40903/g.104642  ORF Transcript_40903/g.104642 Transcript_40903/m.104642 type:complete len:215 (+) Transcript_40903:91-735(+)
MTTPRSTPLRPACATQGCLTRPPTCTCTCCSAPPTPRRRPARCGSAWTAGRPRGARAPAAPPWRSATSTSWRRWWTAPRAGCAGARCWTSWRRLVRATASRAGCASSCWRGCWRAAGAAARRRRCCSSTRSWGWRSWTRGSRNLWRPAPVRRRAGRRQAGRTMGAGGRSRPRPPGGAARWWPPRSARCPLRSTAATRWRDWRACCRCSTLSMRA